MACEINWGVEFLRALPTFIVGGIATWIASQQAAVAKEQRRIAQAKLNLDLFHERMKIFEATWSAASSVVQSAEPCYAPSSMTNLLPQASFLFRPEVEEYMKELISQMTKLAVIRASTKSNSNIVPADNIPEHVALETWLGNAARTGIREKFSPYLNFAEWR